MPAKIIVAFRTRLMGNFKIDPSGLAAPGNYKDPEKIAAWQHEKAAKLQQEASLQPYTATFDEVQLVDIKNSRHNTIKADGRVPFGEKQSVCLVIRQWLLSKFPDAWPHSTHPRRNGEAPEAIFLGFNTSLFLKLLGIECSLPLHQPKDNSGAVDPKKLNVLPLSLWYGNNDHRDIEEAVKPRAFEGLTWAMVLASRGLAEKFPGWTGPHSDVKTDLTLTTELATQLGMLSED